MTTIDLEVRDRPATVVAWVRRFGVAGFLFFFVKGLAWLIVPGLLLALN